MKGRDRSIDQTILSLLADRQDRVSGEVLGRQVGRSRAAVWKRIQHLRRQGYGITASPRVGYKLIHRPDVMRSGEIGRYLRTRVVAKTLYTFDEVTSTNDLAYQMGLGGACEGTVVIAESQTRGRGRMNRTWASPPGKNLYLSLILRPGISPRVVSVLTYMGAISTAETIEKAFPLAVVLKWPNDIFVNGRKLAGLLNEVKAETDRVDFVVLGFGVNLNMNEKDFPPSLRKTGTSVMRELGRSVSRVEFARSLLQTVEHWYDTFLSLGPHPIIRKWEDRSRIRGRVVEVKSFETTYRGVAQGLDHEGALILRDEDETVRVVAGDLQEP